MKFLSPAFLIKEASIPFVCCVVFSALVCYQPDGLIDDAFILFRYARHMGLGQGPVWNIGGPPTEGYTSFLYVVILSLPARWGWDLPLVAQVFNGAVGWACSGVLYWAVRSVGWSRLVSGIVCGCFVLNPFVIRQATTGMETPLYLLLLTLFLAMLIRVAQGAHPAGAFVVGFLAALTRPEAVGVVGCGVVAGYGLLSEEKRRLFIRALVMYFVVPGLCYMGWRFYMFGDWLPNPFYIKQGGHFFSPSGVGYVWRFFWSAIFPFVLLAGWPFLRSWKNNTCVMPMLTAGLICLFYAAFFCTVTPLMGEDFRFLIPLLPLMLWLGAGPLEALFHILVGYRRVVLVFFILFFAYGSQPDYLIGLLRHTPSSGAQLVQVEKQIGQLLNPFAPDAPLMAWGDAGALAFYSEWHFLDTVGLNDNVIARSHHMPLQEVLDYIFDAQPALIVLPGQPGVALSEKTVFQKGHGPHGKAIYLGLFQDVRLQAYCYAATLETPIYNMHMFVRQDAPIGPALYQTLFQAGSRY